MSNDKSPSSSLFINKPEPSMMRVARGIRSFLSSSTAGFTTALLLCLSGVHAFVDSHSSGYNRQASPSYIPRMSSSVDYDPSALDETLSHLLPFEKSAHNSATIVVPDNDDAVFARGTFRDRLAETVAALGDLNKTSVWVEVPMSRSSLIEEMVEIGFEFHNAHGTSAKLNLWLPEDRESKVPEFATHHVGVGAVVINSRNEILCVRELRRNFMPWKVPGGLADLGEHIPEAAQREVMEETGIPTKFKNILSFRHTHRLANGRSDLYFVCHLDPIEEMDDTGNAVIPEPRAQECEIEVAKWVPLSEYRDMVNGVGRESGHPMMKQVIDILDSGKVIKQKSVHSVVPGREPNPMYHPDTEDL